MPHYLAKTTTHFSQTTAQVEVEDTSTCSSIRGGVRARGGRSLASSTFHTGYGGRHNLDAGDIPVVYCISDHERWQPGRSLPAPRETLTGVNVRANAGEEHGRGTAQRDAAGRRDDAGHRGAQLARHMRHSAGAPSELLPLQSDSVGEFTPKYWYLWKDSNPDGIAVATKGALHYGHKCYTPACRCT